MAYNIIKMNTTSTMKKALYVIAVILCILIINNLAHSIYDLWHKQDLVAKVKKDLDKEKQENRRLKARLTFVKSNEFIEEEARNKLFLVKPGESGVILPKDLFASKKQISTSKPANWQQWIDLFVGK